MSISLPPTVFGAIEELSGPVSSVEGVGGGCIANATRVRTKHADLFVKFAMGEAGATFEAEAAGLNALAEANERAGTPLVLPAVHGAGNASPDAPGYLMLELLELKALSGEDWHDLGRGLALIHQVDLERPGRYGFHTDNFIGRLPQRNDWTENWADFFRSQRLEPQVKIARSSGAWRPAWNQSLERLLGRLDDLFPAQPHGATLHGDLWSGNVLHTTRGPALVDPATYYGDGESDLAMADLFGGFPAAFFDAYHEVFPQAPGASQRRTLYQLYHLINHLNHFGAGYGSGVERALRELGGV
jgi:protein-ribulosamine 3-kinase